MKKTNQNKKIFITVLIIGLGTLIAFTFSQKENEKSTTKDTINEYGSFSNPEIAYKECHKILKDLSLNLNQSLESNIDTKH
ncbi:hypothetical protein [Myroides injenensis]|uniref:hypothetical protein n=1 Tax=Myroides injenensis TaxID=1183151 RepID=UPI000288B60B|nr:hypothetical protein [Myroides injenensis]